MEPLNGHDVNAGWMAMLSPVWRWRPGHAVLVVRNGNIYEPSDFDRIKAVDGRVVTLEAVQEPVNLDQREPLILPDFRDKGTLDALASFAASNYPARTSPLAVWRAADDLQIWRGFFEPMRWVLQAPTRASLLVKFIQRGCEDTVGMEGACGSAQ